MDSDFQVILLKKKEGVMMSEKKKKVIDLKQLEPDEKLKYEIAEELGLLDRVMKEGWKSLSSKETGRIGGLVTKRKKANGMQSANPSVNCTKKG